MRIGLLTCNLHDIVVYHGQPYFHERAYLGSTFQPTNPDVTGYRTMVSSGPSGTYRYITSRIIDERHADITAHTIKMVDIKKYRPNGEYVVFHKPVELGSPEHHTVFIDNRTPTTSFTTLTALASIVRMRVPYQISDKGLSRILLKLGYDDINVNDSFTVTYYDTYREFVSNMHHDCDSDVIPSDFDYIGTNLRMPPDRYGQPLGDGGNSRLPGSNGDGRSHGSDSTSQRELPADGPAYDSSDNGTDSNHSASHSNNNRVGGGEPDSYSDSTMRIYTSAEPWQLGLTSDFESHTSWERPTGVYDDRGRQYYSYIVTDRNLFSKVESGGVPGFISTLPGARDSNPGNSNNHSGSGAYYNSYGENDRGYSSSHSGSEGSTYTRDDL